MFECPLVPRSFDNNIACLLRIKLEEHKTVFFPLSKGHQLPPLSLVIRFGIGWRAPGVESLVF